jgi:hypothetical protein
MTHTKRTAALEREIVTQAITYEDEYVLLRM